MALLDEDCRMRLTVDEGSGATAKVSVENLRKSRWPVPMALAASLQAERPAGILVLCLSSQWTRTACPAPHSIVRSEPFLPLALPSTIAAHCGVLKTNRKSSW